MKRGPGYLMLLGFLAVGAYLLWRALQGGGPLYYFFSAVGFGMAIAAMQNMSRGRGR